MLNHLNLQQNQEKQQVIREDNKEFTIDKQDLNLDFRREKASSYIDYKKGANTKNDTAKLGSTSFKSKTEYQKRRNADIRSAFALTKDATAYTLEIHDQLSDLNANINYPSNDQILAILENTEFTPQMMYGNMIRLHLREYVTLIRYYQKLSQEDSNLSDPELVRKQALDKIMVPFQKRVEAFCLKNKINLDGSVKTRNVHTPPND